MSRATVRAAVKAYMDAEVVPNLIRVHGAKPRNWKASEWRMNATSPSSASGYVHIENVVERRAGVGGADTPALLGKRLLVYTVAIVLCFRSRRTDAEAMVDDWDTLVDAIKARLRTKPPVLGGEGPPAIFDVAEEIEDEADVPQDQPTQSEIWGLVRFDVVEMIDG